MLAIFAVGVNVRLTILTLVGAAEIPFSTEQTKMLLRTRHRAGDVAQAAGQKSEGFVWVLLRFNDHQFQQLTKREAHGGGHAAQLVVPPELAV